MTGGGLTSALANVPHFVYRLYDQDGALLYVGATSSIGSRLTQHGSKDWWSEVRGIEVEHYANMREALDAEREVIEATQPKHNGTYTDKYDAGGHKARKRRQDEAHAVGEPCNERKCLPCADLLHAQSVKCNNDTYCDLCQGFPHWYHDQADRDSWWELARRYGAQVAEDLSYFISPIDALLADEAGLTYEQIRGLREHYTGPVTRWNRHNLPRYAPLAEQITSLADAERVAAKHPA